MRGLVASSSAYQLGIKRLLGKFYSTRASPSSIYHYFLKLTKQLTMQLTSAFTTLAVFAAAASTVMGERHTVTMINR